MPFLTTASNVLLLMIYIIPGFIFIKLKALDISEIGAFSKFLMFVCQPCLQLYSFDKVADRHDKLQGPMAVFFVASLVLQVAVLLAMYLIFRKRYSDAGFRTVTLASLLGNVGFFGTPLLEKLLPDYPEAVAFAAVFIVSMNMIAWTAGLFVITGDRKYISVKKLLLCPPVLGLAVALPLFLTGTKLPPLLAEPVQLLGSMSLPICMFILGMRLAVVGAKTLFTDKKAYLSVLLKMVAMPLLALGIMTLLNIDRNIKVTVYLLCACPVASLVQNLSELYGGDKATAADAVMLSNLICMATIPLLCLLI